MVFPAIYCCKPDITQHNFSLADVWFFVGGSCAQKCSLKNENVNKCTRMGTTVLKIVIWGGKSSNLWSQIAFYSSN